MNIAKQIRKDFSMQPYIYEKEVRIPYYLGDRYSRTNLSDLMNLLIEVSGEQTHHLLTKDAEEMGLRWIIIQYDLKIHKMPAVNETVIIRTFSEEYNRLFSYRKFEVYDQADTLLVEVTSVFSLINEERKLTRIPKEVVEGFNAPEKRRIRRMPKPDIPKDIQETTPEEYKVRYFDIDTNFHVNNSAYFDWMLDALEDEFLSTHELTAGNIIFEKEVRIGEKVNSHVVLENKEEDQYISHHQIQVEGIVKCVADFEWKKMK